MQQVVRALMDDIAARQGAMEARTESWAAINSGSYHTAGLARMAAALKDAFGPLAQTQETIALASATKVTVEGEVLPVPLGEALVFRKRPEAPLKVLLAGHYDTVFGADHPFQQVSRTADGVKLHGPGVADLKGGLAAMLGALEALEEAGLIPGLGWTVALNPDEEIGSPGSDALWRAEAPKHHFALIFEPCLPDGGMVKNRKGSGNFTLCVQGRAAHAGRNPREGRNAVVALADAIRTLDALNSTDARITVNPAVIEGGRTLNTVPDRALLRFNVRVSDAGAQQEIEAKLAELMTMLNGRDGFAATLHGGFGRPPKCPGNESVPLAALYEEAASALGITPVWRDTGGVCDGNNLHAYGLPNLDTMGVRGDHIHSEREYMLLSSLTERARLTALMLLKASAAHFPHKGEAKTEAFV